MNAKEWILKLKEENILTIGNKNGVEYLHLNTPCKIKFTQEVVKELKESYEANIEKGGTFIALPERHGNTTYLIIKKLAFLTNVSSNPANSYRPNDIELNTILKDTYSGQQENSLPIRFHTHPTQSDNPINEMLNYIFQCNTSEQDQIVSDFPVTIGDLKVLMPRSLVLCNGRISDRMFIGFYNGLIAPIEFENHREEQIQKAMNSIFESISEWANEGNNKWWLLGGGLLMGVLVIRYNKVAIPFILMLVTMVPMFVNNQYGETKYFAQVGSGEVTIEIP